MSARPTSEEITDSKGLIRGLGLSSSIALEEAGGGGDHTHHQQRDVRNSSTICLGPNGHAWFLRAQIRNALDAQDHAHEPEPGAATGVGTAPQR